MDTVERKAEKFIREHGMIDKGDVVIAGVSGGADSVCLLFVLCALRETLGFDLRVCHVNHGLRGVDADADEAYVRELCAKLGVSGRFFHKDVELIAKKRKQSLEEAGRTVRREAFETMCREDGGTKIATAHHRDDNAETVIWNMARGTGLKGLCGIRPAAGLWIRPLLAFTREEIERYLCGKGVAWCEDATNAEDAYTRNRIRHNILPVLEEQVNRGSARHLYELSVQARDIWDYLEQGVDRAWENCVRVRCGADKESSEEEDRESPGELWIDRERFFCEMPAVQNQLLRRCLAFIKGEEKDIGAVHVAELAGLFDRQSGRSVDLGGGVRARRTYTGVALYRQCGPEAASGREEDEIQLPVPGEATFSPTGQKITCRFVENGDYLRAKAMPQKSYTKWIDYDIIKYSLSARTRRGGDYFTLDDSGSRQKLKSYFINEKIPREDREKMLLIADGDHVVWIPGRRMSRAYHVSSTTEKILEINITEE